MAEGDYKQMGIVDRPGYVPGSGETECPNCGLALKPGVKSPKRVWTRPGWPKPIGAGQGDVSEDLNPGEGSLVDIIPCLGCRTTFGHAFSRGAWETAERKRAAERQMRRDRELDERWGFKASDLLRGGRPAATSEDHRVLGVEPGASEEEVKRAFERSAMEHHPDRGGSAEKFRRALEARRAILGKSEDEEMAALQKAEGREWAGRKIFGADHAPMLDRQAAIEEFYRLVPRHEAEKKVYDKYMKDQHLEAAGHHLAGLRDARDAGDKETARRHAGMYALHCRALGRNPMSEPEADVLAAMQRIKPKKTKFLGHAADSAAMEKQAESFPAPSTLMQAEVGGFPAPAALQNSEVAKSELRKDLAGQGAAIVMSPVNTLKEPFNRVLDFARRLGIYGEQRRHQKPELAKGDVVGRIGEPEGAKPQPERDWYRPEDEVAAKRSKVMSSLNQLDPVQAARWESLYRARPPRKPNNEALKKGDVIAFPGNPKPAEEQPRPAPVAPIFAGGVAQYDYSHLLPAHLKGAGYRLSVDRLPSGKPELRSRLSDRKGRLIGTGWHRPTGEFATSLTGSLARDPEVGLAKDLMAALDEHTRLHKSEAEPKEKKQVTCRCDAYWFPHRAGSHRRCRLR